MKLKIENRFGVIPNHILNSKFLSWKAKGLYGYIQSKPDNWDFAISRISNDSTDGKDSTANGIKELEDYGVLIRNKIRLDNGTYDMEYILLDTPRINQDGKSVTETRTENPSLENPSLENPSHNKTIEYKKRNNNKEYNINENNLVSIFQKAKEDLNNLDLKQEFERTLLLFLEFRKQIKKPIKDASKLAFLQKLEKLSEGKLENAIEILNESIANGWQGIFPIKNKPKQNTNDFIITNEF